MSEYRSYKCNTCDFIYNEADGLPDEGIKPNTLWKDIPEDWECPDCGVGKNDFTLIEI